MHPSALAEARDWLLRADQDLAVTERLLQAPPLLGAAAYHAQQAAEKALKAFLAAHNVPVRPTQNLQICWPPVWDRGRDVRSRQRSLLCDSWFGRKNVSARRRRLVEAGVLMEDV